MLVSSTQRRCVLKFIQIADESNDDIQEKKITEMQQLRDGKQNLKILAYTDFVV